MRKGRLVQDAATAELLSGESVRVRVDDPEVLARRLIQLGRRVEPTDGGALRVVGCTAGEVGGVAAACGLIVRELFDERRRLSDVYRLISAEGTIA
jgi:hypothetical protein